MKNSMNKFIEDIDEAVYVKLGCSVHDLPDFNFADYYDEDLSGKEYQDSVLYAVEDIMYDNRFGAF